MTGFNWTTETMDVVLLAAVAVVVAILSLHLYARFLSRRIEEELRKGTILNGLQYLPAESQKVLTTSEGPWKVVHYYRTPKGGFFVYRAAYGPLGWVGSKYQAISKEEAMEVLGAKDLEKFTEIFGKPKKA